MFTSQLAFREEFQKILVSSRLKQWFEEICAEQSALADFPDPVALRRFLRSRSSPAQRVRELWRALIRATQARRTPEAIMFILGLLQPALGAFVDKALVDGASLHDSAGDQIEAEDVWQEVVAATLNALANDRLAGRDAVLAGLVIDIRQPFRLWLRGEFDFAEYGTPLVDSPSETNFDGVHDLAAEATVLADWCRAARISKNDAELIFQTRVAGFRLSRLAPAQSKRYYRLRKRRGRAEERLKVWLGREQEKQDAARKAVDVPKRLKNPALLGVMRGQVPVDRTPFPPSPARPSPSCR